MTPVKNMAASVKARLNNKAKVDGKAPDYYQECVSAPGFIHGGVDALPLYSPVLYNGGMANRTPYKTNKNVAYDCKYHVVWTPKYRRKVLVNGVEQRLKEILQEVADELQCEIVELEVMPDHVHILCEVDPQFGIHRLVKRFKGRSSRVLREEFPRLKSRLPTLWTHAYFVATVGGAPLQVIKQYIENQKNV